MAYFFKNGHTMQSQAVEAKQDKSNLLTTQERWLFAATLGNEGLITDLQKLAEPNQTTVNVDAITVLAFCYLNGYSVTPDVDRALSYFKRAALSGCDVAKVQWAQWIYREHNDPDFAGKLLGSAVATKHSKNKLGASRAFTLLKSYSNAQFPNATIFFHLAECYQHGYFTEKNPSMAIYYYHRAAELKHAQAMLQLGDIYLNGLDCAVSNLTAVHWFRECAKLSEKYAPSAFSALIKLHESWNHHELYESIAYCYRYGRGVKKNVKKAHDFQHAADRLLQAMINSYKSDRTPKVKKPTYNTGLWQLHLEDNNLRNEPCNDGVELFGRELCVPKM